MLCMGARAPSPASVAGEDARVPVVGCKGTNKNGEADYHKCQFVYQNYGKCWVRLPKVIKNAAIR